MSSPTTYQRGRYRRPTALDCISVDCEQLLTEVLCRTCSTLAEATIGVQDERKGMFEVRQLKVENRSREPFLMVADPQGGLRNGGRVFNWRLSIDDVRCSIVGYGKYINDHTGEEYVCYDQCAPGCEYLAAEEAVFYWDDRWNYKLELWDENGLLKLGVKYRFGQVRAGANVQVIYDRVKPLVKGEPKIIGPRLMLPDHSMVVLTEVNEQFDLFRMPHRSDVVIVQRNIDPDYAISTAKDYHESQLLAYPTRRTEVIKSPTTG